MRLRSRAFGNRSQPKIGTAEFSQKVWRSDRRRFPSFYVNMGSAASRRAKAQNVVNKRLFVSCRLGRSVIHERGIQAV